MPICERLLIGQSEPIRKTKELIRQVAGSDLNVVICGESGVGKELAAQSLHLMSHRKAKPFVKVNCAAIPSELLESELFGYTKGAFTGADQAKAGKFELAHNGTIFLDEIGDMPLFLQSKMLQVLQDLRFSRLGGKRDVEVDCWVLTATNHDLEQAIAKGLFREDLYYRLNIVRIFIPPLRERPEDIDLLVKHFSRQSAEKGETPLFEFDETAMDFLRHYSWPGNVRELKNTVERLMLLGDWEAVRQEMLARETRRTVPRDMMTPHPPARAAALNGDKPTERKFPPLKEVKRNAIRKAERELISAVLHETGWNRKETAKILKISYKALLYKIKDLDLGPKR